MSSRLRRIPRFVTLLCAASVSLGGCGKSEKKLSPPAPDAGRVVTSAPPSAVASSPWLKKRADGTYEVDTRAQCMEILAAPEPPLASLHAARGLRASVAGNRTLSIAPLGLRANLPPGRSDPSSVFVAPARMDVLRRSDLEWERAWAELLDRSLPFESLLFHMGEEPWSGRGGTSVSGLYARIYVVTDALDDAQSLLRARLDAFAPVVACRNQGGEHYISPPPATVTTGERPPWKTMRAAMRVWYSDYGGTAVVELYLRRVAEGTVVLAFMSESESPEAPRLALADALSKP